MIIIIIVMIILTIIMVEVLSNLQFNFHHKLPLESLSKWLKSKLIETEKNDKKLTRIDEIYQDSENPVNLNGPKPTKIVPVSQNEPKVTQDLPKLMELTNIVKVNTTR